MDVQIYTGRLVTVINDIYYEVFPFIKEDLKLNMGYIIDDYIYIYRGNLSDHDNDDLEPGIYKKGNKLIIERPNSLVKSLYHIKNIIELDIERILTDFSNNAENFISPEDVEVLNNNAEVYKPTVKPDDNFLKYLIKKAILEKKINLKNYKGNAANPNQLSNMRSSLNNKTGMTVPKFMEWCEVIGLKWRMEIYDAGNDPGNPLPEKITISSDDYNQ